MGKQESSGSIFSGKLDQVAFTAYFLGAVVPLIGLVVVVERYVFPTLADRLATVGLVGAILGLGVLSLASFFVLRRSARRSLERMDRDNGRLGVLLDASSSLTRAYHGNEAAAMTVRRARELTGAGIALVYARDEKTREPVPLESTGDEVGRFLEENDEALRDLASMVIEEEQPLLEDGGTDGPGAAAAVPLPGEREPFGALLVLRPGDGGFDSEQLDALTTLGGLAGVALSNADLRDAQRNFFSHVTDLLVTALDAHLGYNTGHGQRVARIANPIGREMQLDEQQLQRLHFAALLHDIGLLKFGSNEQHNRKTCEKHTLFGFRMLGRIRLWEHVAPIVLHHHEWFDGSGYPEGLSGKDIPLESRVIAVADAYDSMTSDKSYKVAMPHSEAIQELLRGAGTQFDPAVVAAFQRLADSGVIERALE